MNFRFTKLACYLGYITQAINLNLMPLFFVIFRTDYGVTLEEIGRLVLLVFLVQIFADIICSPIVERIGYRASAILAHVISALGLVLLSVLPRTMENPYAGILIATFIFSLGSAIIEVLISPMIEAIPSDSKKGSMALLHSFYCWGQMATVLITTLTLWGMGTERWHILPLLWAAVPFLNSFLFSAVPMPPETAPEERTPIGKILSSKTFILCLILMMGAGSSELAMSQWSSLFAEQGLGVSKVVGDLLGPCLFAVLMGLGRTWYGLFGEKVSLSTALLTCSSLCVLCYLGAVFFSVPLLSLASCALCGIAVSLMWPATISLTAAKFPKGGTLMFAILAMAGDLGGSLGPYLAGLGSDYATTSPRFLEMAMENGMTPEEIGLKFGLLLVTLFPLLMTVTLLYFKKNKQK